MNRETLKEALEAEANERIECPVCGDEIPAFELSTDHAHSKELLNTILELLNELSHDNHSGDRDRDVMKGFGAMKDVEGFREAVERDVEVGDRPRFAGPTDNYYGEGAGKLRETIIRYDPENVTKGELRERLQQIDEAETEEQKQSIPERRVFGVGNEEDYERISEAAWGVANAFVGSSLHAGHELVACPDCGYEGSVDQAVFPGGTDHYSESEREDRS
ncbi:hypothetical protein EI982_08210 [Haloplanus rallus]|uniref:Uncharacterized protein n=1 Tax=Haloplanus rallus TaxID=1816183 RepID=A0A6B9FFU6_9EURY|nr:hypothetical protein [Haloplanus rallus]QGX94783.1 hypothetical protein EI982_08210 [Haloplanus rallus]